MIRTSFFSLSRSLYGTILAMLVFVVLATSTLAQSRRLGLVIGIGDYAGTPHPTALPDAGLVAQTLKSVGFEVSEAANPTQADFRILFRDFLDKAGAAGPEATIAIYLSGYGLQEDGENILIPTGARLRQRADLAIEGLRLSDFLRALAALPAREKLAILDAAYQHPLLSLVADSARGFALTERQEGMLLGFNHAPGQAAALPRTSYGHYALALAEALREPGLNLNAMFERVRLRVHDLSQGAETPWHISGLVSPSTLNAAPVSAVGTPVPPPADAPDFAAIRARPLAELTVEQDYARTVEIDTLAAYEGFVKRHPNHVLARKVRATIAARREAAFWQRTRKANSERAYWTYLKHYPRGAHASEAERRLERLAASAAPPPLFEEIFYDDLPPPADEEIEIFETVVISERWDDVAVPFGAPVYFLPPPPVEIIELAPPPPSSSRLLPAIAIGAGVVGAAILANRAWRRPPPVRPAFTPPPVVRSAPLARSAPGGLAPVVAPVSVQPATAAPAGLRSSGPAPAPVVAPGAIRPSAGPTPPTPPAGPGAIRPPASAPGSIAVPGTPPAGSLRATTAPVVQPSVPPAGASPSVGTKTGVPAATSPPTSLPVRSPVPSVATPTRPVAPVVTAPRAPTPPVAAPSANVRQVNPARAPVIGPQGRPQGPTIYRGPPPLQARPAPPPQVRQAPPPQVRQAPPPQVRQAPPPQVRQAPPPQVRQAPPPPQARPAPAPQARPQQSRPVQCTPELRAAQKC